MPISPNIGAQYGEGVAEIYRDAELRILQRIAYSLQQGIEAPEWEQLQLARLQLVRGEVTALLAAIDPAAAALIESSLDAAYGEGELAAFQDVKGYLDPIKAPTLARRAAVAALAADTRRALTSATPGILRSLDDVYRAVVADATASVLAGGESRRDATQRALNGLISKGLNGIQTHGGKLSLPNYVTMAVRTATARSALQGHGDSMDEMGLDLVIIHPGPRACDICDKWARSILSRGASSSTQQALTSLTTGEPLALEIDGSLDDARAGGWGHPNCRCGLAAYLPGVTKAAELERPPWDAEGYAAQQQQRSIEHQIRSWKQRDAVAFTPAAKADAQAKIKGWQGAMRDHLEQHPDLKRQSIREQINGTLNGNAARATNPPGSRPPRAPGSTPIGPKPRKGGPTAPSPKIAPPVSSTPKLDALPRLAVTPEGYRDTALKDANPLYAVSPLYQNNCTHCVSTHELRARGFDVVAEPLTEAQLADNGRRTSEILGTYRQADGAKRVAINTRNATATAAEVKSWPHGARGWVHLQWKGGGGGHVFTVENVNGKVVYTDPQLPSRDASKFISQAKAGHVWVARVDDLQLTDDAMEFSGKLRPGALADAKAAALAKLDAELAGLRTREQATIAKLLKLVEGLSEEEARAVRMLSAQYRILKNTKSLIGTKIITAQFQREKLI